MSKWLVVFGGFLSFSAWGSVITPSGGDPGGTPGDLFDVASGVTISSSSPVIDGCDIRDLLGGMFGTGTSGCESSGTVLFKDINSNPWPFGTPPPSGASNYFLTFNTPAPISLNSYNLYLQDDFLDNDANRTVSEFRLYLDDGSGNPVSLLSDVVLLGPGQVNYRSVYGGADDIMLSDTFGEVTGSQFSAVFTSNPLATTGPGPRVFELDGAAVPEPSSLSLLALAVAGLAALRRRAFRM